MRQFWKKKKKEHNHCGTVSPAATGDKKHGLSKFAITALSLVKGRDS